MLQTDHVLITGRVSSWPPDVDAIDLHVLSREAATRFLLDRTRGRRQAQSDDDTAAKALANDDLGGLCLALEQAAAYIGERRISIAEYQNRWNANKGRVREWADKVLMRFHEEKEVSLSVATAWQTTFDQLSPPARSLLEMLAWLAPDPIPEGLLRHAEAERQLRGLAGDPQAEVETALAELRRYSLLLPSDGADFAAVGQVHRLVQLIVRERLLEGSVDAPLKAMLAVLNAYVPFDADDVRTWPVLDPLRPHLLAAIGHAEKRVIPHPTARLQAQLGLQLLHKALYRDAEPLMRRALAIDEKSFGPEDSEVATNLNNLAQLLRATNRLAEAEPLIRRALAIGEESLGPEHPKVAIRLNNLAQLLQDTNRLAEAEPLMRRALAIGEKSFGPEHPNVATQLNNLAQLLQDTDRLAEAEPFMRRALAIGENSLGPEHPKVALRLNNLAQLLQDTDRLAEAEPLMRRALAIDEKSFGPEHPGVAKDLNNLAALLQATNRLAEAEPLMRRAVAILHPFSEKTGHQHPNVQIASDNYRALLEEMNLDETEIARRLAPFGRPPTKID